MNCPTCDGELRPTQVRTMIGNPECNEWCRSGYCSLECFDLRDSGDSIVEIRERDTETIASSETGIPASRPTQLPAETITSGAGFGIRALARLIDFVFELAPTFLGYALGGAILASLQMSESIPSGWEERVQDFSAVGFGLGLLSYLLYHSFCEGLHGASPGKLICGIRVLREDGSPPR